MHEALASVTSILKTDILIPNLEDFVSSFENENIHA